MADLWAQRGNAQRDERQLADQVVSFLPALGAGEWHNPVIGFMMNTAYALVVCLAYWACSDMFSSASHLDARMLPKC